MKNKVKWLKKPMHFCLALLLIGILAIGTTIAFFTDIEAAVNSITTGKIQIEIEEEINGLTKSNIGVRAAGKSECYVRIRADIPTVTYKYTDSGDGVKDGSALVEYLTDGDVSKTANIAEWNRINEMSASISSASGEGSKAATWIRENDGYWYLSATLNPGDYAKFLISVTYPGLMKNGKVELPDGITFDMLTIPIVSEAVQVEGIDVGGATGAGAAYRAFQIVNGS